MSTNSGQLLNKGGILYRHTSDHNASGDSESTVEVSSDNLTLSTSWSRSSENTPGFRRMMRQRKARSPNLPMHPFGFVKETNNGASGSWTYRDTDNVTGYFHETTEYGFFNGFVPGITCTFSRFSDVDAQSIKKVLDKLKHQDVNLGVAAAESGKTVKMFSDNIKQLATAVRAGKRGDWRGAANALSVSPRNIVKQKGVGRRAADEFSRRFLELQYGWKPLLSDIDGAVKALAYRIHTSPMVRVSTSVSKSYDRQDRVEGYDRTIVNAFSEHYDVSYVLYFSQGNPVLRDLSQYGLINLASIAWELVPFSFVVDWALPIGSYLNNLDATLGLDFVKGCKTEFWEGKASGVVSGKSYDIGSHTYSTSGTIHGSSSGVYCSRTVLNGFPQSPLPDFKNPFSQFQSAMHPGDHVLNALALLTSAFGNR